MKDGVLHSHDITVRRPEPKLELHTKWITFRDKLTPGQQETWTLQITDKMGKPARSQLMATMYDMSLDDIYAHNWDLDVRFNWYLPYMQWRGNSFAAMSLYGEMPLKQLYVRSFDFTHYVLNGYIRPTVYVCGSRAVQKSSMTGSMVLAKEEVANALYGSLSAVLNEVVTTGYSVPKKYRETQQPVQKQTSLRKNFNETAFFFPALQTDN